MTQKCVAMHTEDPSTPRVRLEFDSDSESDATARTRETGELTDSIRRRSEIIAVLIVP